MKKLLIALCALAGFSAARAEEGMWLPQLIGKNYEEMKRLGLKLSAEDLFSINKASIKDAVVQFGGGCTGEIISPSGLLITNHHCGYGSIAALSTVEKNYLDNGFWAKGNSEELPAPGLSVIFLERVQDVTPEVIKAVGKLKAGEEWNKKYDAVKKRIEEREGQNGKYYVTLKDYFNGNQYLVLTYKKFNDVRLVGTPPKSLGKFGGDTDNWMWPRHTADFSMFRVYASKSNEPAEYSKDNVPLKPKKYLPVSVKGVKEGDYAMIFGYPGRTNRYEVSSGVGLAVDETNPAIVKIRTERLRIMKEHMDADKSVYLKMTAGYQNISNYWKYFTGQTEQLKRMKVADSKRVQEEQFTAWASKSGKDGKQYKSLSRDYSAAYTAWRPYAKHATYYSEAFRAPALSRLAAALDPLAKYLEKGGKNADSLKSYTNTLKAGRKALMASYDRSTDEHLFREMTELYYQDVPKTQHPDIYQRVIFRKHGSSNMEKAFADYASEVYDNTFLLDSTRFNAFVADPTLDAIKKDPAAEYALSFVRNWNTYYQPKADAFAFARRDLSGQYVRGLRSMQPARAFYPDANSTMRISYGSVKSYSPQDAVKYDYVTTLGGLMDKYKPGDEEFDVPQELIALYKAKDFGRYATGDSTVNTCFITNNDITGGNSGSPVLNGNGEWIGTAFDGNWEAMSGDIQFDKQYKRTIVCDARFVLFLIEKMGKAYNLIEEMDIRQ